jgi:hypothetical protein
MRRGRAFVDFDDLAFDLIARADFHWSAPLR